MEAELCEKVGRVLRKLDETTPGFPKWEYRGIWALSTPKFAVRLGDNFADVSLTLDEDMVTDAGRLSVISVDVNLGGTERQWEVEDGYDFRPVLVEAMTWLRDNASETVKKLRPVIAILSDKDFSAIDEL